MELSFNVPFFLIKMNNLTFFFFTYCYSTAASSVEIELRLQHPLNTSAHFAASRSFFRSGPPLSLPRPEISRSNSTSTHQRLTNQSALGVVLREWSVRLLANQRPGLVEQKLHVSKRWSLERPRCARLRRHEAAT